MLVGAPWTGLRGATPSNIPTYLTSASKGPINEETSSASVMAESINSCTKRARRRGDAPSSANGTVVSRLDRLSSEASCARPDMTELLLPESPLPERSPSAPLRVAARCISISESGSPPIDGEAVVSRSENTIGCE